MDMPGFHLEGGRATTLQLCEGHPVWLENPRTVGWQDSVAGIVKSKNIFMTNNLLILS